MIADARIRFHRQEAADMEEELEAIEFAAARLEQRASLLDEIEQLCKQLGEAKEKMREQDDEIKDLRRQERLANLEAMRAAAKARRATEMQEAEAAKQKAKVDEAMKKKRAADAARNRAKRKAEDDEARKEKQRKQKAEWRRRAAVAVVDV